MTEFVDVAEVRMFRCQTCGELFDEGEINAAREHVAEHQVRKGDRFAYSNVDITVTRVARDGTWADIECIGGRGIWTKRQALPFPSTFRRVTP